jgi:hypothetical protein
MQNLDVVGGIELTISAAIMIATLSILFGQNVRTRVRNAAVLLAWFIVVAILAATQALQPDHGVGPAGLGLAVAAPIVLFLIALRRVHSLRAGFEQASLPLLVAVNAVRVLGVSFLILQANGRLPAPFAPVAGWGDIITGLAAIPIAWIVYRQFEGRRAALLAWNIFGLADLIAAVSLGVLSSPGPLRIIVAEPGTALMTTLPWLLIPGFVVPLLATVHLVIFGRLVRSFRAPSFSTGAGQPRVA